MGLKDGAKTKTVDKGRVPKSIRDVFKPSVELEHVAGLKISVYSRAKVGKTHLAFTCPKPIYGIDTEGSWGLNKNQFPVDVQKQVHVSQVLYMTEKDGGKVDLVKSLDAAQDALDSLTDYIICNDKVETFLREAGHATLETILEVITSDVYTPVADTVLYVLEEMAAYESITAGSDKEGEPILYTYVKPFPRGTIVIDSGTDIWDWLGIWKDEQNFSEPGRLQWGHANKKYNQFIMLMLHSKWNVLGTFKAEAAVSDKGADLGYDKPKWQKKTDYWFDVNCEMKSDGVDRKLVFKGDRFGGNLGTLTNPNWNMIEQHLMKTKKVVTT